jgi:hypothetical protein
MRAIEFMRLDEGGVINAKDDVVLPYRMKNGEINDHKIGSALDDISFAAKSRVWPEEVKAWFETVFFNWLKKRENHPMELRMSLHDYLDNVGIDMIYGTGADAYEPDYPDEDALLDDMFRNLPEYARDGDLLLPLGFEFAIETAEGLQGMIDFLIASVADGQRISRMSVDEAFAMSERWHKQKIKSEKSVEGVDVKTVLTFKDGTRFVKVLTPKGLDRDSDCLRHCVGQGGYDELIAQGIADIYSLRDADDNAHATVEIRNEMAWQIKGKNNGAIDKQYHPHVKDFLKQSGFGIRSDHNKIGLQPHEPIVRALKNAYSEWLIDYDEDDRDEIPKYLYLQKKHNGRWDAFYSEAGDVSDMTLILSPGDVGAMKLSISDPEAFAKDLYWDEDWND